ncbi:MAG: hypothetical protein CR988_02275 [Treponema sp.]|nr:MAG: hypothetical protein CR988_02275 [Treponema sp.]
MQTCKNYSGYDMELTDDVQIVKGVSGNALYFPFGCGFVKEDDNFNETAFSLWRRWDGVADDDYRGILKTANVKIYFDNVSDKLKIELVGLEPVTLDVLDEAGEEFVHWAFTFCKNDVFKAFRNEELVCKFLIGDFVVDLKTEGLIIGGGKTHASFDEIRTDKKVYRDSDIRGLHRLPGRTVQASDVVEIVSQSTPKYLGTVKIVPTTRAALITKGERIGVITANTGDWVLMTEEIGGWTQGVCYKWEGTKWVALQPEVNYTEEYHACLLHLFEIPELAQKTGHFGALFAKVLVAQKAMINELVSNQAFIDNLIVKKLKIDSNPNTDTDFELYIDEDNGILAKNNNEVLFSVQKNKKALFSGDLRTPSLDLILGAPYERALVIPEGTSVENLSLDHVFNNNLVFVSGTYGNDVVEKVLLNSITINKKTRTTEVITGSTMSDGWNPNFYYFTDDIWVNITITEHFIFLKNGNTIKIKNNYEWIDKEDVFGHETKYSCSLEKYEWAEANKFKVLDGLNDKLKFEKTLNVISFEKRGLVILKDLPKSNQPDLPIGAVYSKNGQLYIKDSQ